MKIIGLFVSLLLTDLALAVDLHKPDLGESVIRYETGLYPGQVSGPTNRPTERLGKRYNVSLATLLSFLPGVGMLYLDEYSNALFYVSPFALSLALGLTVPNGIPAAAMSFIAWEAYLYSIFDTYRTARLKNGNEGYRLSITDKNVWEHLKSPYRFENIFNYYSIFTILEMASSLGLSYLLLGSETYEGDLSLSPPEKIIVSLLLAIGGYLFFTPVAVAEEGLFRGYVQGSFREWMSAIPALLASSTIFALVHIPQVLPSSEDKPYEVDDSESTSVTSDPDEDLTKIIILRFLTGFTGGLLFGAIYENENRQLDKSITSHTLANTLIIMSTPFLINRVHGLSANFSFRF